MIHLFHAIKSELINHRPIALVSIIASSGSTPRGAGAHMLVGSDGILKGTIGGGAVEHECELRAIEVIRTGKSLIHDYMLHNNEIEDLGMVCGGDVRVSIEYISPDDSDMIALCDFAQESYDVHRKAWLIYNKSIPHTTASEALSIYADNLGLCGPEINRNILSDLSSSPSEIDVDGSSLYTELLFESGMVYIFGGGHVAQALVPILSSVGFRCVILEDRKEFCNPKLFEGIEKTILIDKQSIGESVSVTADDYVCIMTRGHKDDLLMQAYAMRTSARYIGVIGSRKKIASVSAKLRAMGFNDHDLSRITTPIGLSIGAETPAEIAISIAAQLIQIRAEH